MPRRLQRLRSTVSVLCCNASLCCSAVSFCGKTQASLGAPLETLRQNLWALQRLNRDKRHGGERCGRIRRSEGPAESVVRAAGNVAANAPEPQQHRWRRPERRRLCSGRRRSRGRRGSVGSGDGAGQWPARNLLQVHDARRHPVDGVVGARGGSRSEKSTAYVRPMLRRLQ
jgi:hypothetical protein